MKKLYLSVVCTILILTSCYGGIGIFVGANNIDFPAETFYFNFPNDPANYSPSKLERGEPKGPTVIGMELFIPVFQRIEIGFRLNTTKVHFLGIYVPSDSSDQAGNESRSDVEFGATNFNLSVMLVPIIVHAKYFNVELATGFGVGYAEMEKLLRESNIVNYYFSADNKVNINDAVDKVSGANYTLSGELRVVPDETQVGFKVFGRMSHYRIFDEPAPEQWWDFGIGVFYIW